MSNTDSNKSPIEVVEPEFPALMFLVRHGHPISILCGLFVFVAGVWLVLAGVMAGVGLIASIVAALIVYLLVRVLWDITRLLSETMIPK